jgi:endonuclease III
VSRAIRSGRDCSVVGDGSDGRHGVVDECRATPRAAPRAESVVSGRTSWTRDKVEALSSLLLGVYGPYPDESSLPVLDQLVWFMLSTRTTVENCEAAYAALRSAYPSWSEVAEAPEESLYAPLRPAGLYRSRAANLRALLAEATGRFGEPSLEELRSWTDGECEAYLRSLPGVGLKVARCAMSFGLGRRVFAVDAHIWRITRRMGWHGYPGDSPSERGADAIQEIAVLSSDPLSLHVDMIRLGRDSCPAGGPRCASCPAAGLCPSAGSSPA